MIITANLTRQDIINAALTCPNKKIAAKKLGISRTTLHDAVKNTDLNGYFRGKRVGRPGRRPRLSRADLEAVQGMIIKDAAKALRMSESAVRVSIRREGMQGLFPNEGQGSWIARRGYCGTD